MKKGLSALIVGFLFALGLGISGMTQPAKVVGFLDLFGNWDPSLIFVMGSAIAVHSLAYYVIRKRSTPMFSDVWHVPSKRDLTPSLIVGAILFGVGWGLAGYCPGPALTSLVSMKAEPFIFVASMVFGMVLFKQIDKGLKLQK